MIQVAMINCVTSWLLLLLLSTGACPNTTLMPHRLTHRDAAAMRRRYAPPHAAAATLH